MQGLPEGGMLAVFGEGVLDITQRREDAERDAKGSIGHGVYLAADNGSHLVFSGLRKDLNCFARELDLLGITSQFLNVSHGFHSPLMQPMVKEFKKVAKTISYSLPKIPIVANLTGELATDIATPNYWIEHILQPVQFGKGIEYLDKQVDIFLEIGTKPILINIAKSLLDNKLFLHSLDKNQDDWQNVLETLAQLYIAGVDLNWKAITQDYHAQKISLPTYPFQRQKYWFDIPTAVTTYKPKDIIHPLLGENIASPLPQIIFQSDLATDTLNWLQDHCLENKVVFPGTAYLEMAIASGIFHYNTNQLTIKNVQINTPLYLKQQPIQTILDPQLKSITWKVYSLNNKQWQLHTSGEILPLDKTAASINLALLKSQFSNAAIEVKQHYLSCQQKGINYGKSFQGIKELYAKDKQALGLIELPQHLNSNQYYFHPALLDACLQILFAALQPELQTTTYIPVGLNRLDIYKLSNDKIWSYLKLKSANNHNLIADVWLFNRDGELIAEIEGLKSQAIKSQPAWHNWLYQQQWKPQPLLKQPSLSDTGNWLIFTDSKSIGKQLATQLKSQQQICHLVKPHPIFNYPQAFDDLIQQHSGVTGIVYLWNLDNIDNWSECKSYLYLVQALVKKSCYPRLYLVTRNAQPVNNYQLTSGIKNSCLWGMQKAIALEHPELLSVAIDLDLDPDKDADNIFQEICAQEIEVAYRNGKRYVARLVRYDWETGRRGILKDISKCIPLGIPSDNKETGRLIDFKLNKQLEINYPGNLDSLQWKPLTRQQPQDNEIEIEVKATGLNFRDVMVALDLYPDDTKFLGLECAGIVTKLGSNVQNFKIGDEVIAISDNSFSQYLNVNSLLAIPKPPSLSLTAAATIPVTFLTTYYTLVYLAQLQPGEKILIHAAAGGVGLAAIQIARNIGAQIYATASTSKWELLQSMGVTKIMNSRNLDFAEEIITATNGEGVDVVLNSLSGEFIAKSIGVLNQQGRFLEIGKQDIWSKEKVARVKPNINYFVIDLWQITQNQPQLIQQMLRELLSQFTTGALKPLPHRTFTNDKTIAAFRYMQQGKHQGKIIISDSQVDTSSKRVSQNFPTHKTYTGTYLIAGGMGAIGLQVAQWLIDKGVNHLVLLGRNHRNSELQHRLKKSPHLSHISFIKADIADSCQLTQALKQIESNLPPLRGVIHCAGVKRDRTIVKQDWDSFESVLAPKVKGAWNLHHLTQKYDLESFIMFSSASSLIGSAGQANYCAGNAFLDALAHARRSMGLPGISINWSAWQNTGLAADTQITAGLKQKGIGSIKPSQGIEILEQLLLNPPAQIGVIPIDWDVWQKNHFLTPFYRDLVNINTLSIDRTSNKQKLLNAIPQQRQALLIQQISQEIGNILGIKDINKIDLELGFSELGLDSLGSVELRNKLQTNYELKLSQTVVFDYPNIKSLTDYLLSLLFDTDSTKANKYIENSDSLNIESLSEAEAEALLLEELQDFDLTDDTPQY